MTPDIDAGFAQIARQRIAHAKLRYYVWLPIKRAIALWFVPHAQYYPFQGELFPLDEMDHENHQDFWLPIFVLLTLIYTTLGVAGAWLLWMTYRVARIDAIRWLLLAAFLILPRWIYMGHARTHRAALCGGIFPLSQSARRYCNLVFFWRKRDTCRRPNL